MIYSPALQNITHKQALSYVRNGTDIYIGISVFIIPFSPFPLPNTMHLDHLFSLVNQSLVILLIKVIHTFMFTSNYLKLYMIKTKMTHEIR